MIHVCSLARLHATVEEIGARHLVTLLKQTDLVQRPPCIHPDKHLILGMDDIVDHLDGHIVPADDHVTQLLTFVRGWDRAAPLLLHCYAGISRSTAAAYVTACTLNPGRDERSIAQALRRASPTATPNPRIVALADDMLSRRGRMVDAIQTIGTGVSAFAGEPFRIDLD
jgi:predicted protein tyrosine phosphatase